MTLGALALTLTRWLAQDPEGAQPPELPPPAPPPPVLQTELPPPAPPPAKVEVLLGVGLAAGGSSWSGDPSGSVGLVIGVRLFRIVTPFVGARLGYARIDQRLLIPLTFGITLGAPVPFRGRERAYPYLRAAFVHQHEESVAAVTDNLAGALLGIGSGIRHRAGGHFGLGCDFTLTRSSRAKLLFGPEVSLMYLTYSAGPSLYGYAGLNLGGSFQVR